MKKLIYSFVRDGRRFEVIDHDGQLKCCLVRHAGDGTKESKLLCYAEYEGCNIYQSPALWQFVITKDEMRNEEVLYQRFLSQTDYLRLVGAF